jgi:hypothetical protein
LQQSVATAPDAADACDWGLEYSRLADDDNAMILWQRAAGMEPGNDADASDDDRAWMKLLSDQLQERTRQAHRKPPNVMRSTLFTVRCWPNDVERRALLAGLEAAQHNIYADFGIPMSNTEVVLWRSQSEFQRYTGGMTGRETSEFVTALTMTQWSTPIKGRMSWVRKSTSSPTRAPTPCPPLLMSMDTWPCGN